MLESDAVLRRRRLRVLRQWELAGRLHILLEHNGRISTARCQCHYDRAVYSAIGDANASSNDDAGTDSSSDDDASTNSISDPSSPSSYSSSYVPNRTNACTDPVLLILVARAVLLHAKRGAVRCRGNDARRR